MYEQTEMRIIQINTFFFLQEACNIVTDTGG